MIRGKQIYLRAIEETDSQKYYEWINDEETNQWRGLYHPTNFDDAKEWITSRCKKSADSLNLSIATSDGTHVGFIGLQGICARSRRAEVWIYIGDKNAWGKGLGEDCIRTLSQYAFEQMNLHRLWLECNPDFTNVVRCYEKVGYVMEGRLRQNYYRHGAFRDTCIMGLLREDFKA